MHYSALRLGSRSRQLSSADATLHLSRRRQVSSAAYVGSRSRRKVSGATHGALRLTGRRASSAAYETTHDMVVVGGGVMGVWAAIAAAKRGAKVALVDQFEPAHSRGSSHGDGRIFRLAYEQDHYVDMMEHSLPLWRELQAAAGEPLLATTGGVTVADTSLGTNRNDALRALYQRRGIAYETLSASETNARFPQYSLAPHLEALYQQDFGVLFASKVKSAQRILAAAPPPPLRRPWLGRLRLTVWLRLYGPRNHPRHVPHRPQYSQAC